MNSGVVGTVVRLVRPPRKERVMELTPFTILPLFVFFDFLFGLLGRVGGRNACVFMFSLGFFFFA